MYCPGDDINKERVMEQLEASDEEDEEDELDEDDDIEDIPPHVKVDTLVSDIQD